MLLRVLLAALLGLLSISANSATLVAQYTGVIYSVGLFYNGANFLGLTPGSTVSGSFIFDTICTDTDPSTIRAFFQNCIRRMQFESEHSTPVSTDYSYFLVDANPVNNVLGAYVNTIYGNISDVYEFNLEGGTGAFQDDTPDFSAINLSDFLLGDALFLFQRAIFPGDPNAYQGGPVDVTQYYARFTSLRFRPVPEPGSLALLTLGLAGLALTRRLRP